MNRRKFLKAGLAGSALPLLAGLSGHSLSAALSGWADGDISLVVSDARFSQARRFAAEAERAGLHSHAIDGDITRLWRDHLLPGWRRQPGPLAGMTARQPLFCLEQLARDHGLRVVFRAEHEPQADGSVRHRLSAPASHLRTLDELLDGQPDWSERLARYSNTCSWGLAAGPCGQASVHSAAVAGEPMQEPLISWVMAPIRRT